MATATDYGSSLSTVGFVPYELMEGTQALAIDVSSEMTDVSNPMDQQGGGAYEQPIPETQQVTFSPMIDSLGATERQFYVDQVTFEAVPRVYKMRGYSTTLGQYVHWKSYGDALAAAPAEYGTVINVSSELIQ